MLFRVGKTSGWVCRFENSGHFFEPAGDFDVLRAHFFALPAVDAVGGLAEGFGIIIVIYGFDAECRLVRHHGMLLPGVVQRKIIGDGNIFWTASHTVLAGCAGNGNRFVDDIDGFIYYMVFFS